MILKYKIFAIKIIEPIHCKAMPKTTKKKQQALNRNRAAACSSRSGEFKAALVMANFKKRKRTSKGIQGAKPLGAAGVPGKGRAGPTLARVWAENPQLKSHG